MAAVGILRVATLDDGSTWGLPDPHHLQHCLACWPAAAAAGHARLLQSYTRPGGSGSPQQPLEALKDDGYILQVGFGAGGSGAPTCVCVCCT